MPSTSHGIDLSDDGRTLFVASKSDGHLTAIDLLDSKARRLTLDPAPYHVTVLPGTNKLSVSSRAAEKVWVIDQNTLDIVNEIPIGGIGHQMVVMSP